MQYYLQVIFPEFHPWRQGRARFVGYGASLTFLLLLSVECFSPATSREAVGATIIQTMRKNNSGMTAHDPLLDSFGAKNIRLVRHLAREYRLDYRIILAIISHESGFDEEAVSDRGAVGFMQVMPVTDEEIREVLDLDKVEIPAANISAGVYYFAKLYNIFDNCAPDDRVRLALAAYNAGPSRIYDAQKLVAYMGENPRSWSSIQNVLPLLSKRYYSLHQAVWKEGKPRSGYFGSWRQTVRYVANTFSAFKNYQQTLR